MNTRVRYKVLDQVTFADLLVYSKLPSHPFWSHVEKHIDFSFADALCACLYSPLGQRPYAPSLKLKVHLVQRFYNLSDRLVEEKIIGDLFIKRFLGVSVEFFGLDHSTIALDRDRLGPHLFQACHLYILAQLYSLGLWGHHDEQWILDSFPTEVGLPRVSAHRLIQQAFIRLLQHLKRHSPEIFCLLERECSLDAVSSRLPPQASTADRMLAFSKLAAQAYTVLQRLEMSDLTASSECPKEQLQCQHILRRILNDYVKVSSSTPPEGEGPSAGGSPSTGEAVHPVECATPESTAASAPAASRFEKVPFDQRSADRIVSVVHPEARIGHKTRFKMIEGFKTQNLITSSRVILLADVVPANEHDRDATVSMVNTLLQLFPVVPRFLLGDSAYGHGAQREKVAALGLQVVAPLPLTPHPTGLYDATRFEFETEHDRYRCPQGHITVRQYDNVKLEGAQYYFPKAACANCPLRAECTTNKNGRSVFRSRYAAHYEAGAALNASEEGRYLSRRRKRVEQKNQELKNDAGLGYTPKASYALLRIKASMGAIVTNLKHAVKRLSHPRPGFLRRAALA
ncbi:transposase [Paenibacillus sp. YN15]|uniref:transposase n=1 Tax=Paenibacillus sp. YN15 TaxID=1742774 RepID=UPI000DCC9882|nr:transposase [Paenibacillus sp. YN15]RAV02753.1 DDE transposase [Paenibacillus sp. YN15]